MQDCHGLMHWRHLHTAYSALHQLLHGHLRLDLLRQRRLQRRGLLLKFGNSMSRNFAGFNKPSIQICFVFQFSRAYC